jgi:hypothetical protein
MLGFLLFVISEMFKEEIRERQDRLVALDEMTVDIQMMSKAGDKCSTAVAKEVVGGVGLPGSFRKLEID